MRRRLVHRALAVLVLTAALGLAGAHPAAAQDLGFFERSLHWLVSLWTAPQAPADGLSAMRAAGTSTTDAGLGIDPNGTPTSQPSPPSSDATQ
jgi:hypothetical protein